MIISKINNTIIIEYNYVSAFGYVEIELPKKVI